MAIWHGYIGIEDLGLTTNQRQTMVEALSGLGKGDNTSQIHKWMQIRPSLDNKKVIFEAVFDDSDLTIDKFKTWLGNIYNVDPSEIFHSSQNVVFNIMESPVLIFTYNSIDRLRFVLFGGLLSDRKQSASEASVYISSNLSDWESIGE